MLELKKISKRTALSAVVTDESVQFSIEVSDIDPVTGVVRSGHVNIENLGAPESEGYTFIGNMSINAGEGTSMSIQHNTGFTISELADKVVEVLELIKTNVIE